MTESKKGLELLREPFPDHQVRMKPQGTKAQNTCPPTEKKNCDICGGWHHPRVAHLAYVGHAAVTDRLLDADPAWSWEPMTFRDGLPAFDATGGLWIRLTVCGMTRIGYGHAAMSDNKEIGSREKEVIGDAIRNAAMRFGAALELWHKGDLHVEEAEQGNGSAAAEKPTERHFLTDSRLDQAIAAIKAGNYTVEKLAAYELTEKQKAKLHFELEQTA